MNRPHVKLEVGASRKTCPATGAISEPQKDMLFEVGFGACFEAAGTIELARCDGMVSPIQAGTVPELESAESALLTRMFHGYQTMGWEKTYDSTVLVNRYRVEDGGQVVVPLVMVLSRRLPPRAMLCRA